MVHSTCDVQLGPLLFSLTLQPALRAASELDDVVLAGSASQVTSALRPNLPDSRQSRACA